MIRIQVSKDGLEYIVRIETEVRIQRRTLANEGGDPGPASIPMTPRERDILALVVIHKCNKEIAAELNISVRTVKFHISNLMRKCQVQGRHELLLGMLRK
jgi:DNA-binding CsgD family transcriptional regulator